MAKVKKIKEEVAVKEPTVLSLEDKKEKAREIMQRFATQMKSEGKQITIGFGSEILKPIEFFSTEIPVIDYMTGGGIPKGWYSMIWGPEKSGKTTAAFKIMGAVQRQGGLVAYLNNEGSYVPEWAATQGLNTSDVLGCDAETLEDSLDWLIHVAENKIVDLLVIDTLTAIAAEGEIRDKKGNIKSVGQDTMALIARKLSQFFRASLAKTKQSNMAVLLLGQARMDLGGLIVKQQFSGGEALKHSTRMRLKFNRVKPEENAGEDISHNMRVTLEKTSVNANEGLTLDIPFHKGFGFDEEDQLVAVGLHSGLITTAGPYYSFGEGEETIKVQGKNKLIETLKGNKEISDILKKLIQKTYYSSK